MDFHWDWVCSTLFEEGCDCSEELPPQGALAHVGQPLPDWPYQVTWLGQRSIVQDFVGKPAEQYDTWGEAIAAVEATVRDAGHTVNGV